MVIHGWYTCPRCHRKLQKVTKETVIQGAPIYCRKCKKEWFPTIFEGNELREEVSFMKIAR